MKRRDFIRNTALTSAGMVLAPYILPSGRLFAATGSRVANHVVFVLFGGGIRNQESIDQQYLANQGSPTQGNIMENMLSGARPGSNLVYNRWAPVLGTPLAAQGVLFKEVRYAQGPTGHFNGHTVAMTGNYTATGLNLNVNPDFPTVFEYYRKHYEPTQSAINAWWLSEGLGPYPSLNYSRHPSYGPLYGANYLRPATVFDNQSQNYLGGTNGFQPDDVARIDKMRSFLNSNFKGSSIEQPGIQNSEEDRAKIKKFLADTFTATQSGTIELPMPNGTPIGQITGDLVNITYAWQVMKTFRPELMVINTFNLDICHSDFSSYIQLMHKADYGVGWLWNKIQSDPVLANDTIMICMPEHGRNLQPNNVLDRNGFKAYDHTSDENSRRSFCLVVGPPGKVKQGLSFGTSGSPVGESIDVVPTIAHILGFKDKIPSGLLPGRVLNEAFV